MQGTGYGAASEYGGYSSDSGYGYQTYIDCTSAIALFGFLGLINILRDIVTSITNPRRRKRSDDEDRDEALNEIMTFISDGGIDGLYEGLPEVVLPMLTGLMSSYESSKPGECQAMHLCEANHQLTKYGTVGAITGHLLTNVVTGAFVRGAPKDVENAYASAYMGRAGQGCHKTVNCTKTRY